MKTYNTNTKEYSLVKNKTDFKNVKISESKHAVNYARNFYHEDISIYESCFLILLNRANNTTGFAKISQGGTAGTVVDVKLICKYAIETLSSAVILVHNHPSGALKPSTADINITKKTKEALKFMDCELLDHIIITESSYYSFLDEGII